MKIATKYIKAILKPVIFVRKAYWKIIKPETFGVRAIVLNDFNQILLVKHTYSDEWYLPGGKVHKNESLTDAIKRELQEEVGITNMKEITVFHKYLNLHEHKKDHITVFIIKNFTSSTKEHFEIEKKEYFSVVSLPIGISRGTKRRINEFFHNQVIQDLW